jgi:hypothetical protein
MYTVRANTLTETRGKFHLAHTSTVDQIEAEIKAHRDRQTFDNEAAAISHCKWVNSHESNRKRIQLDSGM